MIITTFELLYRACLRAKHFLEDFGLVVIDEFHVLYDKTRGYNLEKLLTILKECKVRTICLSATFEDKREIGEWLGAEVVSIPEELRPVQITHGTIDLRKEFSNERLCKALIEKHNQPYLIFCSTKRYTTDRAIEMFNQLSEMKNDEKEIIQRVKRLIAREELPDLESMLCSCLTKGVGFHRSDLHKNLRNFVAELFRNRRIDYLFSTTGLAYGINFPTRAVVVADLTLWDYEERRSNPIPSYMYLQMAGRAGRPQYDDEGFCYLVIRKDDDLAKFEEYKKGVLKRATSQVGHDEYFLKALLELVYSKRDTDVEIMAFFENSLFNFQASKIKDGLVTYDLKDLVKKRLNSLHDFGFLELLGINYQLTNFGKVTLDYLFSGFSSPELSAFIQFNQYLEKKKSVRTDFDLIYFISKTFPSCRISKQPYKKSKEVEQFLRSQNIAESSAIEYSAYVIYNRWIENFQEAEIDNECSVYSSNLASRMWEMYRLLGVYEKLARARNLQIPSKFQVFKDRMRHGVREDELPLVMIPKIGREVAKKIRIYCYNVLQKNLGYTGTPMDILQILLQKQGKKAFIDVHITFVPLVGPVRAENILSFVERKSKVDNQKA